MTVAPVGWAWLDVLEEADYPLHYRHSYDRNHPSPTGTYLTACVIHATLFAESPVGLAYDGGISCGALKLQQAAASTVLDSSTLWRRR